MNAENLRFFVPLLTNLSIAVMFPLYFKNKYKFINSMYVN